MNGNDIGVLTEKIREILKKYDFYYEVPQQVKQRMLAAKKRTLRSILKTEGSLGVTGGAALSLFFRLRQMGISLSFGASSGIVKTAAAFAAIVLISGAALTVNRYVIAPYTAVAPDMRGTVIYAVGEAKIQRPGAVPADAAIKMPVNEHDILLTGDKSRLVVQIQEVGTITVLSDSKVTLTSLLNKDGHTEAFLDSGKVFSKILKLRRQTYGVKSKTCVVAVRGTEFLTSASEGATEVQLREGKVQITALGMKKEETVLEEGKSAMVRDDGSLRIRELTVIEKLELEKLALSPYIENLRDKTSVEIEAIFQRLSEAEHEIDEKIRKELIKLREEWRRLSPLDRLRRQGKPISKLHLRGGEMIAGSVIGSRGGKTIVDTGAGVIRIPAGEIIKREEID